MRKAMMFIVSVIQNARPAALEGSLLLRCLLIVAALLSIVAWSPVSNAQTPAPASSASADPLERIAGASGNFEQTIPIAVPEFHGLAPRISLNYDSGRGSGFVSVGWSVGGLSVIERASPRKGAPYFGLVLGTPPADIYLLDGSELVPCPVAGPSCASGGTHATKVESYLRIARDVGANTWTVWGRDGTQFTYLPLTNFPYQNPSGIVPPMVDYLRDQFRWVLSSATDPHGNVVQYNYWCDSAPACFIDTISYNGTIIRFYRESRAVAGGFVDNISRLIFFENERIKYRLKSVDILLGTERIRTYALAYDTNPTAKRARLTSITEYGRDAAVDAAGTVTAGTSKPPISLTYAAGPSALQLETITPNPPTTTNAADWVQGDFDGNGKFDFARAINACTLTMLMSNGSLVQVQWATTGCTTAPTGTRYAGDYNGDGKTDIAVFGASSASIYLSNGTGFALQSWPYQGTAEPASSAKWIPVHLNGDGRMDFVRNEVVISGLLPNITCKIYFRLSTGSAFNRQVSTQTPCLTVQSGPLDIGDFNGDGLVDLAKRFYSTSPPQMYANIHYSNGAGFNETQLTLGGTQVSGEKWFVGDVTGDGVSDFIKIFTQASVKKLYVYPSNQSDGSVDWGSWTTTSNDWAVADVNGDGLADLINTTASRADVLISNGTRFFGSTWSTSTTSAAVPIPSDVNGDGRLDIVKLNAASGSSFRPQFVLKSGLSTDLASDLLTGTTSTLGGTIAVQYTPSSEWSNTNFPYTVQTVSSVAANDGRGTGVVSTTTHTYAGALWNSAERRFLGFASSTSVLPLNAGESQPPKVETTFAQTLACAGAPITVKQKDGAGVVLRQTDNIYTDNSTALPYTCLNTQSQQTVNAGGSSKFTAVTRTFDSYGNATQLTEHGALTASGNLAATGDEVTAEAVYQPNTTAYIVGLPARVRQYAGVGVAGTKLTENFFYYDGNTTNWQTPPVKGDATRLQSWLDTTGGFVTGNAAYDTYGNVTSQTDPLGNITTLIYDTTYHLFVTEARDPLYPTDSRHKTTATWDYVCSAPTETRDVNNLATTIAYDPLCRPRKVTTPSGAFACTNYLNLGSPTAQHIETQTVAPAPETVTACSATSFTAGANVWSRTYLDGFGRTYRAAAEGPGGTQTAIEALTAYNARGNVASATAPFYVNGSTPDTNYTTTWKYDALGRKIEKQHPDANKATQAFALSTITGGFEKTTVSDELLRPHTVHTDAYGRTIRTDQLLGSTTVTTSYQYDLLSRLTGLTDHVSNQWTYTYDSLGRRTAAADPDLGNWSYVYDAAGRLTDQTDAKGQVTHLTYDALGRVLTKTAKHGTAQAATDTFTYDQARAGFYNVGRQTTAGNAAATIEYNFDNEGRAVGQTYTVPGATPGSYGFTAAFDTGGRLLRQTYPDGDMVGTVSTPIGYDAAGRLKAVPGLITNVVYDARGNTTNVTRQNGASTVMGYSAQRGWLNTLVTSSTAGTIQNYTYSRDALGRISGVTSPQAGDSWTYGYDDLDRLLSADNATDNSLDQTFTYDLVGNMLTNSKVGTYTYPAAGSARSHAVTGISGGPLGTQSFTYDANGSMTVQGADTRSYDGLNRLVGATDGAVTTQFVYAPDGARLKKTASGATTLYFGDDVEVIPGGTPQYAKYLPGDAKRVGLATTTWLHRDHLQSVRAITNASGAILDSADYRPFGDQLGFSSVTESKGFIGQRQDDETQLMYLHARYYDPVLSRFIQADPLSPALPGVGVNRYAYALNNPVMMLDPSGLNAGEARDNRVGGGIANRGESAGAGGGGYSNADGGPDNNYGFSYCPNCAHQVIGAMIDGERVFLGDASAKAIADLYHGGAFGPAWDEAAEPIAKAYARVLDQLRAAHPGLFGTQIADAGWLSDVLSTPVTAPVQVPVLGFPSVPLLYSHPEYMTLTDYADVKYIERPLYVGDLVLEGLTVGALFSGGFLGRPSAAAVSRVGSVVVLDSTLGRVMTLTDLIMTGKSGAAAAVMKDMATTSAGRAELATMANMATGAVPGAESPAVRAALQSIADVAGTLGSVK